MKDTISQVVQTRVHILSQLNELSLEQLNKIPEGFNNTIIWNLGHLVAAEQGICYKRSNLPTRVEESFFELYKPGSKPLRDVAMEEVETIKKLLSETPLLVLSDYEKGIFREFTPFTTRYGVELKTIEDGIRFLLYHEGLHGGVMMSQKKLVK